MSTAIEEITMNSEDANDIYVPERNWRNRASPMMVVGIPQEIYREVQIIRRRFGIDVVNIVLLTYNSWGSRTAKLLIRKISKFNTLDELLCFLEERISMFDEKSRAILANLMLRIKTNKYFDELIEIARKQEEYCSGVYDLAVKIFHELVARGQFHSPECIVDVAMALKCRKKPKSICASVAEAIKPIVESIK